MYIVGQTGEIIVNSDHIECIYEEPEKGLPAVRARTQHVNVTLGIYNTKQAIDRAMADLALALMAGDTNRMNVYMMAGADGPGPANIPQKEGGPGDGEQRKPD